MAKRTTISIILSNAVFCAVALAQNQPANTVNQSSDNDQNSQTATMPVYRITVIARTINAVNYRHRSGSTKIDFQGTSLMPEGRGHATVVSRQGAIHVDAEMRHMRAANSYGPEYMTYVLWAISPEGRAVNLGEVLPNDTGTSHLSVTSDLQSFGLIVTAEPYFAVTQPSDVVVMQNFVTDYTNGTVEQVDAKYELLKRGQYTLNVNPAEIQPLPVTDYKTPLEVYEARNAIRIAKWAGAEQYASDSLQKAELDLQNAEGMLSSHGDKKALITDAREAAQTAEDARAISVSKIEAEQQAADRKARQDAQATAEAEANAAAQAKQQADDAARAQQQAEAARAAALAQQQTAEAQAETARAQAQQAEQDRATARAQLRQQLNTILQTRESARGLIMNMSDVLFSTGKYTLKPEAREKLAKVSGILLAHPGLTIEVEGHTDNVGSDEYNQTLSEERAQAVRDYLVEQGVPSSAVSAKGLGETGAIASNDTSSGRAKNRRVDLVVSGQAISTNLESNSHEPVRAEQQ
jgi:outer membrane protein OmpA-like peptidoglycan-associated protein